MLSALASDRLAFLQAADRCTDLLNQLDERSPIEEFFMGSALSVADIAGA